MIPPTEAGHAAWGAAAGPLELSCLDGIDNFQTSSPKPATQAQNLHTARRAREARLRLRRQRLVEHLHRLGPSPLGHFLREVEAGASIPEHLETYARIDPGFVRALGGDRFAPIVHVIDGGKP